MSDEYWARHASWHQRRYSPVARMAKAFVERVHVDTDFMTKHRPNPDPNDDFRTRVIPPPTPKPWQGPPRPSFGFGPYPLPANLDLSPSEPWYTGSDARHFYETPFTPPTKDPMNDSLKLALKLNLTTWKTVTALLTSGKPAELNDVANANIESLNLLLKAEEKD